MWEGIYPQVSIDWGRLKSSVWQLGLQWFRLRGSGNVVWERDLVTSASVELSDSLSSHTGYNSSLLRASAVLGKESLSDHTGYNCTSV